MRPRVQGQTGKTEQNQQQSGVVGNAIIPRRGRDRNVGVNKACGLHFTLPSFHERYIVL